MLLAVLLVALLVALPGIVGSPTSPLPVGSLPPAGAQATTTTEPIPPPAAFVVVDGETGAVLLASNEHQRRPPASISKLMTALVVRRELKDSTPVVVSAAAEARPARKLSIKAGQTWVESDLLRAMLLCSCNDVAWALAETAGGSVGGFGTLARAEGARLGLVDDPVLQDPAGLDDEDSVKGGNRVSACDMAVIARAFLADSTLAAIVLKPEHRWRGPDGIVHSVVNHNRLLGTYPGATGVKTGYTARAGGTLVASARRDGRTVIAVIMGSASIWYHAPQLLDLGFATPSNGVQQRLPALPGSAPTTTTAVPAAPTTAPPAIGPATTVPPATSSSSAVPGALTAAGLVVLVAGVLVALRRRQVVRRRARARDRAARRDAVLSSLVDPGGGGEGR